MDSELTGHMQTEQNSSTYKTRKSGSLLPQSLHLTWQEVSPSVSTVLKSPELQTVVIRFQHQQASEATCPKRRGGGRSCLSHSPRSGLLGPQQKTMRLSHLAGFLNDPKAHKHGNRLSSHLHQCKSAALKSQLCPERGFKCLDWTLGLLLKNKTKQNNSLL